MALVDLSTAGAPRLAMLNGDETLYAASLPKIAIRDPHLPAPQLLRPATGGGLWVGKAYGKAPAYRRDPLEGLSHGATAYQVARFYYRLDRGELVSAEHTRQMKAALADQGIRHNFVKGLESRPDARLYRKSGTWRRFHSDSALVEGRRGRYILVGIAEDARGGEWLERIAAPLHDLVAAGQTGDPGR